MTAQHDTLVALEAEHHHVSVRDAQDGSSAVVADCFDQDPCLCAYCGREEEALHVETDDLLSLNGSHRFRVAVPVLSYRISPSGFRQLVGRQAVIR